MSYGKVNKTTGERIPYAGNSSGGGTSDYTDLTNKPSINNVMLSGNKTASDLSLASTTDLATKQDKYETITYAQWQALTPAQQAAKDYYISDYPSSQINAGNISYNNSSSGMSANNVQSAVDELNGDLTNVTRDVTSEFALSVSTQEDVFFSVVDNPVSRVITIYITGTSSVGFPNGGVVVTAPSKYRHNIQNGVLLGAGGSAREANDTYNFVIATTQSDGAGFVVNYSRDVSVVNLSFILAYRYANN